MARSMTLLFLSPVLLALVYFGVYFLLKGRVMLPGPGFLVPFLVLIFFFPLVVFFLYRVILFSFFSEFFDKVRFSRQSRSRKKKKKKASPTDEALLSFKLLNSSQEKQIAARVLELSRNAAAKLRKRFNRLTGKWDLGQQSHFQFPFPDEHYTYLLQQFKTGRVRCEPLVFGFVAVSIGEEKDNTRRPKQVFDRISRIAEVMDSMSGKYGGGLVFCSGNALLAAFAGEWDQRQKAIRTVKAAKEIYESIGEAVGDTGFRVVADIGQGREGFWLTDMGIRHFLESRATLMLRSTGPWQGEDRLQFSQRLVGLVKGKKG